MRDHRHLLKEANDRYERLVRAANGFIYSVTLDQGKVVDAHYDAGCESVTGYTADDYGQDIDLWHRTIHPDDLEVVLNQIKKSTAADSVDSIEHRIIHRDGTTRWVRNTSIARRDQEGRLIGYEGLISDITDIKKSEADREALIAQLQQMALRDSLTGLMNRRGFEEEFNRLWSLALRHSFSLGLLVIDLDHFKQLNDSYGHAVGDRVLQECARVLAETVRVSDAVCRFGGDEFTVILPWSQADETGGVARRILTAIQAHSFCKVDHDLQMRASIGIASLTPTPNLVPSTFLERTDRALYLAKKRGRNQFCDWTETKL